MVKVPPMNSLGFNLFALAFSAISLLFAAIYCNPFAPALKTIGVMSPASVATAILMSACSNFLMNVPPHYEFTYGTSLKAKALALIKKSLTEILFFETLLRASLNLI